MPFRAMLLRGARVYARCDQAGALVVEQGKVEIRYKLRDGRRYEAHARNLSAHADGALVSDEAMGDAEAVERSAPAKTTKAAAPSAGGPPPMRAEPGQVIAYADGACSGNPGPSGLGVVMLTATERRDLSEYLGEGTNNTGELTAILRAAEAFPAGERELHVYTDSSYAIGVLSKGWKAKANQALIAAIKQQLAKLPSVTFHHVRGHRGVPLNEAADRLAVLAVERRQTQPWSVVKLPPPKG